MAKISNLVVDFYEDVTIALFFVLTWMASMSIQIIIDDVQTCSLTLQQASCHQMMKWKRNYCSIINFVQGVGQFFDVALFLFIVKQFMLFFLFFILAVFFALLDGDKQTISYYVVHLLKNAALMSTVVCGSQIMKRKADALLYELTTMRCFECTAQSQVSSRFRLQLVADTDVSLEWQVDHVNEFIDDIQQRYPRIAPMMMFEISPELFLSVRKYMSANESFTDRFVLFLSL